MAIAKSTNDIVYKLFSQVKNLLVDMGLMLLEKQYIDATKMESAANKYTFFMEKDRGEKQGKAGGENKEHTLTD